MTIPEQRISDFKECIAQLSSNKPGVQLEGIKKYTVLVGCHWMGFSKTKLKEPEKCATEEEKLEYTAFSKLIPLFKQKYDERVKIAAIRLLRDVAMTLETSQAILTEGIVPELVEMLQIGHPDAHRYAGTILNRLSLASADDSAKPDFQGIEFPWEPTVGILLGYFIESVFCLNKWNEGDEWIPSIFRNFVRSKKEESSHHIPTLIELSYYLFTIRDLPTCNENKQKWNTHRDIPSSIAELIGAICEIGPELRKRALLHKKTWKGEKCYPMINYIIEVASIEQNRYLEKATKKMVLQFLMELNDDDLKNVWLMISKESRLNLFSKTFLGESNFDLQKLSVQLIRKLSPLCSNDTQAFYDLLRSLSTFLRKDKENIRISNKKIRKYDKSNEQATILRHNAVFELRNEIIDAFHHLYNSAAEEFSKTNFLALSPPFYHFLSCRMDNPELYSKAIDYLKKILNDNKPASEIEETEPKSSTTNAVLDFFENLFSNEEKREKEALNYLFNFEYWFTDNKAAQKLLKKCLHWSLLPRFILIAKQESRPLDFQLQILERISSFMLNSNSCFHKPKKGAVIMLLGKVVRRAHKIIINSPQNPKIQERCLQILEKIALYKFRIDSSDKRENGFIVKQYANWQKPIKGYFKQIILADPPENPELIARIAKIIFRLCCFEEYCDYEKRMVFRFRATEDSDWRAKDEFFPLFTKLLFSSDCELVKNSLFALEAMAWPPHEMENHRGHFPQTIKKRYEELAKSEDQSIKEIAERMLEIWGAFSHF